MLKFPDGLRDFYDLITENYFYVDRTGHILLENFGKAGFLVSDNNYDRLKTLVVGLADRR